MKKAFIIISIMSLFLECKKKSKDRHAIISQNGSANDSLFNSEVKQFALPYPENFQLDSNILIFFGSRPFDTSFLIHLKTEQKEVAGVYYEVIPTFHNDLSDYSISANKLLFFEGYSFILDSSKWEKIKSQAEKLTEDSSTFNINNVCNDCEVYGLYCNRKSNIGNAIKYRSFYKFLKEAFLDSFITKRKPIMYKVNNL